MIPDGKRYTRTLLQPVSYCFASTLVGNILEWGHVVISLLQLHYVHVRLLKKSIQSSEGCTGIFFWKKLLKVYVQRNWYSHLSRIINSRVNDSRSSNINNIKQLFLFFPNTTILNVITSKQTNKHTNTQWADFITWLLLLSTWLPPLLLFQEVMPYPESLMVGLLDRCKTGLIFILFNC